MRFPRTPQRNSRVESPSLSDSSQAMEDNKIESEIDEDENPHYRRWEVDLSKELTPDSKKLKNGKYGMFSHNSQVSPFKRISSTSKRLRPSQYTAIGKKRERGIFDDMNHQRDDSPLFEPETGFETNNFSSDDDVIKLSPTPLSRASRRLKRRKTEFRTMDGSHQNTPILIPDLDSECEIIPAIHDAPVSKPSKRPFKAAAEVFKESPLSGSANVLQDYLNIIEQLSEQTSIRTSQLAKMRDYDKEDTELAQKLANIPAEQETLNKSIADKCAAAIQNDMKNLKFADVENIQTAFQMRREAAEQEKKALPELMLEKEVGYETRRDAITALKTAAESELRKIEDEVRDLKKRKELLEMEGGCALGFELGRKAATKLSGQRRKL